jgi:hypothetical protein
LRVDDGAARPTATVDEVDTRLAEDRLSGIGESGAVVEVDLFGVQVDVTAVEHSVSLTLSLLLARHGTFTPRGTTWMIIYMSGCAAAMTSNPMPDRSVDHHIVVAAARAGSDGRDRVHDVRASKVGGAPPRQARSRCRYLSVRTGPPAPNSARGTIVEHRTLTADLWYCPARRAAHRP